MLVYRIGECAFTVMFCDREMKFLKSVDICDNIVRDLTLELLQANIMYHVLYILGGNPTGIGLISELAKDGT